MDHGNVWGYVPASHEYLSTMLDYLFAAKAKKIFGYLQEIDDALAFILLFAFSSRSHLASRILLFLQRILCTHTHNQRNEKRVQERGETSIER